MMKMVSALVVLAVVIGGWWLLTGTHTAALASGHPEWTPIMYQQDGQIVGAGPELVAKIFADLGLKVSFPASGTWDEVQAKAKSGDLDVLVAAYKTDERLTYMDYSDAYTTDPIAVFVKTGSTFPFGNNEDLIGKHGVAMVGDSYGQRFDDFSAAKLEMTRVATNKEAFDMLSAGTADYFVYSLFAGEDYMKKQNMPGAYTALPTYVDEPNFYITVSKKSPYAKYLPQINERIAAYKADGTIAALVQKYKNQ